MIYSPWGKVPYNNIKDPLVSWNKNPPRQGYFGHYNPFDTFYEMQKRYGNPDKIDTKQNGFGIWYNVSPFEEIAIKDEEVLNPNLQGLPLVEFVYVTYKIPIPTNDLRIFHKLPIAFKYDPKTNNLMIRSVNIDAATAIISLMIDYITQRRDMIDVQGELQPTIMSVLPGTNLFDPANALRYKLKLQNYKMKNNL